MSISFAMISRVIACKTLFNLKSVFGTNLAFVYACHALNLYHASPYHVRNAMRDILALHATKRFHFARRAGFLVPASYYASNVHQVSMLRGRKNVGYVKWASMAQTHNARYVIQERTSLKEANHFVRLVLLVLDKQKAGRHTVCLARLVTSERQSECPCVSAALMGNTNQIAECPFVNRAPSERHRPLKVTRAV